MGLIEIQFDIQGNPQSYRAIDGAPYWTTIPTEDRERLFAQVKHDYPNGFHSRWDDTYFNWLKDRLNDLASKHSISVKDLTRHGSLMVDGVHHDAYLVTLNHPQICEPLHVVETDSESFAIFRPYIQAEEFGSPENLGAFDFEDKDFTPMTDKCQVAFWKKEIVSVRNYSFSGKVLTGSTYGFKNNAYGFAFNSKFGNFMISGGEAYPL